MNMSSTAYEVFYLLTTSEYYYQSVVFTQKLGAAYSVTQGAISLVAGTFGAAWNMWPFLANEATSTNYIAA